MIYIYDIMIYIYIYTHIDIHRISIVFHFLQISAIPGLA